MACLHRAFHRHTKIISLVIGITPVKVYYGYKDYLKRAAFAALFAFFLLGFSLDFGKLSDEVEMTGAYAQKINAIKRIGIEIVSSLSRLKVAVEIAQSTDEQARGLMFRRSLKRGHGMLFLYGAPQEISMWMRNTYISLDMVFFKADGRVHRIASNTEPFSEEIIYSMGNVTAVLEIGAGEAKRLGIEEGDRIIHSHFTP